MINYNLIRLFNLTNVMIIDWPLALVVIRGFVSCTQKLESIHITWYFMLKFYKKLAKRNEKRGEEKGEGASFHLEPVSAPSLIL